MTKKRVQFHVEWNGLEKDVHDEIDTRDRNCGRAYYSLVRRLCHDSKYRSLHSKPTLSHTSPFSSHRKDIRPCELYPRSFFRQVSTPTQRPSPPPSRSLPLRVLLRLLLLHLYFALPVQFIPTRPLVFDATHHTAYPEPHSTTPAPSSYLNRFTSISSIARLFVRKLRHSERHETPQCTSPCERTALTPKIS